jgi:reductive dehalogenase
MSAVQQMIPVKALPDEDGEEYREGKKRYPWWVKKVDNITTETDDSKLSKPGLNLLVDMYFTYKDKLDGLLEQSKNSVIKANKNKTPGRSLRDLALHYAANTYMYQTIGSMGDPYFNIQPGIQEMQSSWKLHPPQKLGLERWEGSKQESYNTLEKAAIQLGAGMIGVTTIKPQWANTGVKLGADVEEQTQEGMKNLIPKRMKYVVSVLGVNPPDLTRRNKTELGAAGDRAGYEAAFMATTRIIRFIKGLGYEAIDAQALVPVIPYAIESGLGELGRMNRMINPIFGGNIRIGSIITDFPLALDKPIDFGLQKFCVGCKKCARECPVQALSHAEEPYWEPVNQWQVAGKKAYFENNQLCFDYQTAMNNYCSTCMSVCPWSKQDTTVLHDAARIAGSKAPFLSKYIVYLDDFFGYGLIEDKDAMEEWWSEETPVRGVDSRQGRN